jgi:hypothetical protein
MFWKGISLAMYTRTSDCLISIVRLLEAQAEFTRIKCNVSYSIAGIYHPCIIEIEIHASRDRWDLPQTRVFL